MAVHRIKNRRGNFVVLDRDYLYDNRLSGNARFLLTLMLSLPDNWHYSQSGLSTISGLGVKGIRNYLKELEQYGYLRRVQNHYPNGKLGPVDYEIYEALTLCPEGTAVFPERLASEGLALEGLSPEGTLLNINIPNIKQPNNERVKEKNRNIRPPWFEKNAYDDLWEFPEGITLPESRGAI